MTQNPNTQPSIPNTSAYQKRDVLLSEVIARVELGDLATLPRLILAVSPCRSGSTILLRVFGATGVPAHFQQLKNILRWRMQAGEMRWAVPHAPVDALFLKETLGPYVPAESTFNPLEVLLSAGYPPDKLHLLALGRHPLSTWASWMAWWVGQTSLDRFAETYRTVEHIRRQAQSAGVRATTLVYEAFRDNDAASVVVNLFRRLDLSFSPIAVTGWHTLPTFGSPASNVIFPEEPPAFVVPGIHNAAEHADRLQYVPRSHERHQLPPTDVQTITDLGLLTLYRRWLTRCQQDLNIAIP